MNRRARLTAVATIATAAALAWTPGAASASTSLNPTSLAFASQQVGTTSAPKSTTLTLVCTLDILDCVIGGEDFSPSISTSPGFSQTNNCPALMNAGFLGSEACVINVIFAANVAGSVNGILSTGPGGPTATLSGLGIAAPAPVPTGGTAGKCKKGKSKKKKSAAAAKKKKGCKKRKKKGGK